MGDVNRPLTIAVTGAGGFIGRHAVAAARRRGHSVRAMVRDADSAPAAWRDDPMITAFTADLATEGAQEWLTDMLAGADAVIHLAAAMTGDDDAHARNTLRPTEALLSALAGLGETAPRLVLVSSIAVYDGEALAEGAMLDETAPLATGSSRDAYCRSKIAQEKLAMKAADAYGLDVRIMRPGAVFGPGRLWNGHIGPALGPVAIRLERKGEIPVSYVRHCAEALALAAERPLADDDRAASARRGRVEIINVVDDDRPDRTRYLAALARTGWPRLVLPFSWRLLAGPAAVLAHTGRFSPGLAARTPGLLRRANLHARMKPVRYGNMRLHERLGWRPELSFEEAMARAIAGDSGDEADA